MLNGSFDSYSFSSIYFWKELFSPGTLSTRKVPHQFKLKRPFVWWISCSFWKIEWLCQNPRISNHFSPLKHFPCPILNVMHIVFGMDCFSHVGMAYFLPGMGQFWGKCVDISCVNYNPGREWERNQLKWVGNICVCEIMNV